MTNQGNVFEPLDFEVLQQLANEGKLDALAAFTSDGRITVYAPQEGVGARG
jgi:hypothetical protein